MKTLLPEVTNALLIANTLSQMAPALYRPYLTRLFTTFGPADHSLLPETLPSHDFLANSKQFNSVPLANIYCLPTTCQSLL